MKGFFQKQNRIGMRTSKAGRLLSVMLVVGLVTALLPACGKKEPATSAPPDVDVTEVA